MRKYEAVCVDFEGKRDILMFKSTFSSYSAWLRFLVGLKKIGYKVRAI